VNTQVGGITDAQLHDHQGDENCQQDAIPLAVMEKNLNEPGNQCLAGQHDEAAREDADLEPAVAARKRLEPTQELPHRGARYLTANKPIKTLADLVRVCEIDTKEWEIVSWKANKWEAAAKDETGWRIGHFGVVVARNVHVLFDQSIFLKIVMLIRTARSCASARPGP
jgi:hypothetical protein